MPFHNYHFNTYEKLKLGWLPSDRLTTVLATGVYSLYPNEVLSTDATKPQSLKVFRKTEQPTGDTNSYPTYYTVEYRRPQASSYDAVDPMGSLWRDAANPRSVLIRWY